MLTRPHLAVATLAAWLAAYLLVRLATRDRKVRPSAAGSPVPGGERPAVVGLLAACPWTDWHAATVLDLAARGLLVIGAGPAGLAELHCQLTPAATEAEAGLADGAALADYEALALGHVRRRAGTAGSVPVAALADGSQASRKDFREAFTGGVRADARRLGLTRPRISAVAALALILAGAAALAPAIPAMAPDGNGTTGNLVVAGIGWVLLMIVPVLLLRQGQRLTPAGRRALAAWLGWRAALGGLLPAGAAGDRQPAYAAALGAAPEVTASFRAQDGIIWSHYTGTWRQLRLGKVRVPGQVPGPVLLSYATLVMAGTVLGDVAMLRSFGGKGAAAFAVVPGVLFWLPCLGLWRKARRAWRLPALVEFDGQVLRRWDEEVTVNSSDSSERVTVYNLVIDDGASPEAWALRVSQDAYDTCPDGTIVHAVLRLRRHQAFTVSPACLD